MRESSVDLLQLFVAAFGTFKLCKVPRPIGRNTLRAMRPFTTGGFLKCIWSGCVPKRSAGWKTVLSVQVPDATFIERQPEPVIFPRHSPSNWVPWNAQWGFHIPNSTWTPPIWTNAWSYFLRQALWYYESWYSQSYTFWINGLDGDSMIFQAVLCRYFWTDKMTCTNRSIHLETSWITRIIQVEALCSFLLVQVIEDSQYQNIHCDTVMLLWVSKWNSYHPATRTDEA